MPSLAHTHSPERRGEGVPEGGASLLHPTPLSLPGSCGWRGGGPGAGTLPEAVDAVGMVGPGQVSRSPGGNMVLSSASYQRGQLRPVSRQGPREGSSDRVPVCVCVCARVFQQWGRGATALVRSRLVTSGRTESATNPRAHCAPPRTEPAKTEGRTHPRTHPGSPTDTLPPTHPEGVRERRPWEGRGWAGQASLSLGPLEAPYLAGLSGLQAAGQWPERRWPKSSDRLSISCPAPARPLGVTCPGGDFLSLPSPTCLSWPPA